MTFPGAGEQRGNYGKHKVVAALVTFVVVWGWLAWGAPDLRDSMEGIALRSPGHCFREKRSGDMVQARITVEQVLPDSLLPPPLLRRWKVRSLAGHPFVLLAEPSAIPDADSLFVSPDTLRVRGYYDWNVRGGVVRVDDDGWIRR